MSRFRDAMPDAQALLDADQVVPLPTPVSLQWIVQPKDGRPSWDADIRQYANGDRARSIKARPLLAEQLAIAIRPHSHGRPASFRSKIVGGMTKLWRFLDYLEEVGAGEVTHVGQVSHGHGHLFKTWLLRTWRTGDNRSRQEIGTIRYWLEEARRATGIHDFSLLWPSIQLPRGTLHRDVDPRLLRPLYHYLKRLHIGFVEAGAEGQQLLRIGQDPRSIGDGQSKSAWSDPANYAVLAAGWVDASLRAPALSMHDFAGPRFNNPKNYGSRVCSPAYVEADERTAVDAIRWFVPTVEETTAAFVLVMLHTGWNPETVANIDVSDPACWMDERLHTSDADSKTATVAIYAFKGRSSKEQIAFSLRRPQGHPFKVISAMIERTKPLRESLSRRLTELQALKKPTLQQTRAIDELRMLIRSPWLYFRMNPYEPGGRAASLRYTTGSIFRRFCNKVFAQIESKLPAEERAGIRESLDQLVLSDIRDGFASFIYDNSLFNIILLKQALGHGRLRVTRAYLRQRRQLSQRFEQFTNFQETFFEEIRLQKAINPTILYLRLSVCDITDEQRRWLTERRLRTRMGMGCLNPELPPPEIAPDHQGGFCTVQRCTLCVNGVVFDDTLPDLAIRQAELSFIRSNVASERFQSSTFQYEWLAILTIVEHVYSRRREEFDLAYTKHLQRLERGEAYLFDQIPSSLLLEEAA